MNADHSELLFAQDSPFNIDNGAFRETIVKSGKVTKRRKGDVVFKSGDPVSHIVLVLSGQLHVSRTDKNGRSVLIHPAIPGSWVGFVGYFYNKIWPYDLTAGSSCELYLIQVEGLEEAGKLAPELYRNILNITAFYSCFFADHLMGFVCKPLETRVLEALISFSRRYQSNEIPMTQANLAAFLGVTRETIAQQLSSLQKSNFIKSGYGKIVILEKEKILSLLPPQDFL